MSLLRKARRAKAREEAKLLKQFIGKSKQQQDLEDQFAGVFRDYGLDPYGANSEQFQEALKTHGVK